MKRNVPSASELGHKQPRPENGTSGMFARGVGTRDSTTSAGSDSPLCHITFKAAHTPISLIMHRKFASVQTQVSLFSFPCAGGPT